MEIRDILSKLRPLKKRMHINAGLHRLLLCICSGSAVAMLVSYISLLIPIPYILKLILNIYLISAAAGLIISLFSVPGTENVIKTADSLGLKERVLTAWQLKNEDTAIARIQREDAYKSVVSTDFKSLYPLRFPKRLGIALCVSMILTAVSFAVPANAKDSAKKLEELKNVVEEQLTEIEKAEEKIKEEGTLSPDEIEKIDEELKRLSEELKKAKTEDEALKAIKRAENQIEKLDAKKQLEKLGEMLSQYEMTEKLGQSISASDAEALKQALEQLKAQMEQQEISPEELKNLLEEVAEQIDNGQLQEKLMEAAQALSEKDMEANVESVESLGQALYDMIDVQSSSSAGKASGQLSQVLQNAKSRISRVDSSISQGSSSNPGKSSSNASSQGQSQSQGKGQASGQTQSQGKGKGQSAGQGAGSSEGEKSGGGVGEGTTNKDSGYGGSEQQGGGRKPGKGSEEEYERLYDPDYLGGDTDPSYVSGQPGEDGESSYYQNDLMPVEKGAILPYNQVLKRYKSQASSYMEETEIPAAMKDIVRQYFESLE